MAYTLEWRVEGLSHSATCQGRACLGSGLGSGLESDTDPQGAGGQDRQVRSRSALSGPRGDEARRGVAWRPVPSVLITTELRRGPATPFGEPFNLCTAFSCFQNAYRGVIMLEDR